MIEIKEIKREHLKSFIDSAAYQALPFLPISYHRAISHLHNPRVENEDVILFLAYEGETFTGYLGVLADHIYTESGARQKCGWLSCMWVDQAFRGRGISKKLVRAALASWNQKILVTEFTRAAKGLYDRLEAFKDLQIISGCRIYRRFHLEKFLPPKHPIFARHLGSLRGIDRLLNLFFDLRFKIGREVKSDFQIHMIEELTDPLRKFIDRHSKGIFRRSSEDLAWILNYPWIKVGNPHDPSAQRYHFSSVARSFKTGIAYISPQGNISCCLLYTIRNGHLKIPYIFFEDDALDQIVDMIIYLMKKWQINTLTTFHPMLKDQLPIRKISGLLARTVKRHYIISRIFNEFDAENQYLIQDGDADCAFT